MSYEINSQCNSSIQPMNYNDDVVLTRSFLIQCSFEIYNRIRYDASAVHRHFFKLAALFRISSQSTTSRFRQHVVNSAAPLALFAP